MLVVGTGTDVGKTWLATALIGELRGQGRSVAVRKPVQSYRPGEPTDADRLARASGERPAEVCPPHRSFERPMAPPMAAQALGRPSFTIADLLGELAWPAGVEVGLIEGAGGVRSPLADDGDAVDLAAALRPRHVVLVADAGLGTLNLIRLSVDALAGLAVVVYLNRFEESDDLHRRNRAWLEGRQRLALTTDVGELASLV